MASQYYSTGTAAITGTEYTAPASAVYGKHLARTLKKAQVMEQLTKIGEQIQMPQNKSEIIEFTRWLPYGGVDNQWLAAGGDTAFIAAHLMQEGVTPEASTIDRTRLQATMQQYGCLYGYTDKTRILHELGDTIPREMEDQMATRMMICAEMMVYGEMKACTNKFYGGTGNSVGTVNGPPTRTLFQEISRTIQRYHGGMLKKMLKSGPNFGSQAINAGWPVYCHTDMEATFENMVGFTAVKDYASEPMDPNEIGSIGRFRIIVNPLLTYAPGVGAVVGNAVAGFTPKSDSPGTNIDVYPLIIPGQGRGHNEGAFGQVALRGFDSMMLTHIPTGTKSPSDPFGQRGLVGAMSWRTQKVLNDAWMAVAFVGTEAL